MIGGRCCRNTCQDSIINCPPPHLVQSSLHFLMLHCTSARFHWRVNSFFFSYLGTWISPSTYPRILRFRREILQPATIWSPTSYKMGNQDQEKAHTGLMYYTKYVYTTETWTGANELSGGVMADRLRAPPLNSSSDLSRKWALDASKQTNWTDESWGCVWMLIDQMCPSALLARNSRDALRSWKRHGRRYLPDEFWEHRVMCDADDDLRPGLIMRCCRRSVM